MKTTDWIQTYSGIPFWPLEPEVNDIQIEDIAHALSMTCRFGGHCKKFYSVAEHSVLISRYVSTTNKMWGLLHDASEAYLVDLPRPIKAFIPDFKLAENNLEKVIASRFHLSQEIPKEIKDVDFLFLKAEAQLNMNPSKLEWLLPKDSIDARFFFWSPEQAEKEFLETFYSLGGDA